jgi:hypothetical protein
MDFKVISDYQPRGAATRSRPLVIKPTCAENRELPSV